MRIVPAGSLAPTSAHMDKDVRSGLDLRMRLPAAVACLVLAAAGCSHKRIPAPAPVPIQLPLIALEAAKVEGLGFAGANLSFRALVQNPNPTPISVARVDYALDVEGARAAQGALADALAIPPAGPEGGMGEGEVVLPVQVRLATIPGVARILAAGGDAAYVLGGVVTFHTIAGDVRVPLSQSGRLVVPKAPRFQVEKVVLRSASPREVTLEMRLGVTNPNAFAMPPGRVACGLLLSNKEVVRADVALPEVEAGGTAGVAVPVKISVFKAGKAVARLLLPFTSLDAAVKGEAVFGGVPVPLDLSTSILPGG